MPFVVQAAMGTLGVSDVWFSSGSAGHSIRTGRWQPGQTSSVVSLSMW